MKKKNIMLLFALTASLSFIWAGCGANEPVTSVSDTVSVSKEAETDISTDETSTNIETTNVSTEASAEVSVDAKPQEDTKVNNEYINMADVSWIDPEKPMVALSFDDGPVFPVDDFSPAIRIQNALSENGMHATFFYWGNTLNSSTVTELTRAYELGFELGNHTKSHPNLTTLSAEEIKAEIAYIDEKLTEITGYTQFLVRPPYLAVSDLVKESIDVPLITCGIDTKDWDNATSEQMITTIKTACENGSLDGKIVLLHETYTATAEAVEYLVPYLKDQGYQVVTISEMFKARGKNPLAGKVYTQCVK